MLLEWQQLHLNTTGIAVTAGLATGTSIIWTARMAAITGAVKIATFGPADSTLSGRPEVGFLNREKCAVRWDRAGASAT